MKTLLYVLISFLTMISSDSQVNKTELLIDKSAKKLPLYLHSLYKINFYKHPIFSVGIRKILVDGKEVKSSLIRISDLDWSSDVDQSTSKLVFLKKSEIVVADTLVYGDNSKLNDFKLHYYDVSQALKTIEIHYHARGRGGQLGGDSQIVYRLIE